MSQIGALPDTANIGFVYFTENFAANAAEILGLLKQQTGVESWVGTAGAGVLATGREYYGEAGIAVMIAGFARDSFNIFSADPAGVGDLMNGKREWIERNGHHFGIIHADPRHSALDSAIPSFVEATNSFLVGGLTSSSDSFPQIANVVTEAPFSGVLFAGDIGVVSGLTQGCTPVGPMHQITSCQGNVAIAIDGRPALEVLKEDIGELLSRDLRRIGGYIHAALPVAGSDQADYLVRNLLGLDAERGLVAIAANLEEGTRVMFCRRDTQSAYDDLVRMLDDVSARASGPPRGAVYYSCVARGPGMFGPDSAELKTISDRLGDVPLVGFFCNGEISHDRLYGYTGVLSLFT
ncbi:MAG: FIST C-terminal domain-containing protein [Proteobacteria bacterium]|nr:FIST C-terminal domain-containing protein [Pseudomonadota bacterium]